MKRAKSFTLGTVSAIIAAAPAQAADISAPPVYAGLPAVSGPNYKVGIAGGAIDLDTRDGEGRVHGEFTYTAPLSFSTGFQFDGAIGAMGGDTTVNADAHYFFRDPSSHLLGVWGGFASVGSNDIWRFGPEVEFYHNRFTFQGTIGWENSDSDGDHAFAHANIAYYVTDNVQVYGGLRRTLDRDAAAIGFEALMSHHMFGSPASFFAEAQFGDEGHDTIWAGMRFYLHSEDKTLIRRHREDDPPLIGNALNQLICIPVIPVIEADSVVTQDNCGNLLGKKKLKKKDD